MGATETGESRRFLTVVAWSVILLVSLLPDILFQELAGSRPARLIHLAMDLTVFFFVALGAVTPGG